jgi:hypothetical protein
VLKGLGKDTRNLSEKFNPVLLIHEGTALASGVLMVVVNIF